MKYLKYTTNHKVLTYNIEFKPDRKLEFECCYDIHFTDEKDMRK